ncbi:hydrolase 76 protein [Coniothyrium glycines]
MFARSAVLSLVSSIIVSRAAGLQLDVTSQDSIKDTAKSLASSIVSAYIEDLKEQSIPGLFSEEDYYFWESGAVLGGLIDYYHLTSDSQYNALISEGLQWQLGESNAFMPANQTRNMGNDDQSFWGLAAMTAAEAKLSKPQNGEWVDFAANVFDVQAARLQIEEGTNGTCGGGLRWQIFSFNSGYSYKDTMSNGNFFLLAARLAKYTGNATYSEWAEKSYNWAKDVGIVSNDYSVYAGASAEEECQDLNHIQWSAYHGTYTEGAAVMYNLTNGGSNWTDTVKGLVNSSSVFLENDVLVEVACEEKGTCDTDQRAFKGIAARSYARAAVAAPFVAESVNKQLEASAKGAARACDGSDEAIQCSLSWADEDSKWETASAKDGNLGEVFGALAVVQGLLYKSSKPVATSNGTTSGSTSNNATQSTGTGAAAPANTGSAGRVATSLITVLIMAVVAVLSC